MENTTEINKAIAKNLTFYRKASGLTQAELAEKISYSDKSISKWESGNGVPDVYTLMQIAQLFGVTLNDLVGEGAPKLPAKERKGLHAWIMFLVSGVVWLVATCSYVMTRLFMSSENWWTIFLYAVVINAIVIIIFAAIWKYRVLNAVAVTALIWTAITATYVTLRIILRHYVQDYQSLWTLYLLGIPLQVLECMWGFFRSSIRKKKAFKANLQPKQTVQEETGEKTENV